MKEHLMFLAKVAVCLAIINRISMVKSITGGDASVTVPTII